MKQDFGFAARTTLDSDHAGTLNAALAVRRLIDEGFCHGDLEVCDELIGDGIVEHQDCHHSAADARQRSVAAA